MNPLAESVKQWLLRKPVEPSVMEPVGSRARLAADTQADRESRADVLRVLGMLPIPGSQIAQVAGDLTAESETTPLGVAKAVAGAIMPVRAGKGKINVMGEASKVDPDVLLRIKRNLARGLSTREAYEKENALPLSHGIDKGVADAWVPIVPSNAALTLQNLRTFRNMRDEADPKIHMQGKFGDLLRPEDLTEVEKFYPELMKTPVSLKALDPGGSGEHDPAKGTVTVDAFNVYGPNGLVPILGHEMTHALQTERGLPMGYNPTAVAVDRDRLAKRIMLLAENGTPADRKAVTALWQGGEAVIPPGTSSPLPNAIKSASPEIQKLARALAWDWRGVNLLGQDGFSSRLYRAYHGEQAAEGARQWLSGGTPHFTTPLAKQIFHRGVVSDSQYALRLQKLYEMQKAGLFDPLASPYEFPATK